eukprot:TRINITY_DN1903_c0_g1_i1.p1 TRINITY_DN1903_c0_g1~~TRINITY_DN1903_c0_g1_i1.p1  ORF type:complete len:660 (+),score=241.96 TRINITY_DN1903_c0_g1_i1:96-2075(+)
MSAFDTLEEIIKNDLSTQKVDLSKLGIKEFDSILPTLTALHDLRELDIKENQLTNLPSDMSVLANLNSLNIMDNPFTDIKSIIPSLLTIPKLENLSLTLTTNEEAEEVIVKLPGLKCLNETTLEDDEDEMESAEAAGAKEVTMTQQDLESVAVLYGAIRALHGTLSREEDSRMTAAFDNHVQTIMKDLGSKLDQLEDPFMRQSEILMGKHMLYQICFNEITSMTSKKDPQFGTVLRKLAEINQALFGDLDDVLHDMRPHYVSKLTEMQNEVARAEKETQELLEAAELLDSEAATHAEEKKKLGLAFEKERQKLAEENGLLRAEHAAMKQKIQELEESLMKAKLATPKRLASPRTFTKSSLAASQSTQPPKEQKVAIRNLSLKQLKDHIEDIYNSKVKFDQKCADAHLPRETMEQHMYTYLNQKYGLRSLIIEHASAITKAINKYSNVDNDVAVFGKIMKNDIDEEFRFVQQQLKDTVQELLRVYLKGKFPLKTDDAINAILDKKMKGTVDEEEWVDIVKYMYNREDSLSLIVLIKDLAKEQTQMRTSPSRRAIREPEVKESVKYGDFVKILLDFQLKGHEKFLAKFRRFFRDVDNGKSGVINEVQFRELLSRIDVHKTDADVNGLLELVDPYNNQKITFSEAVSVLSQELLALMNPKSE